MLGPAKTITSDRWLELPAELIAQLKAWKAVQAQHVLQYGLGAPKYVFTNLDGGPRDPIHVSRFFTRIFARAKIENASLHTLRHTCATYLLAQMFTVIPIFNQAAQYYFLRPLDNTAVLRGVRNSGLPLTRPAVMIINQAPQLRWWFDFPS